MNNSFTNFLNGNTAVVWITILLSLAILVVVIIGQWKMFEKAGKPGWACIIPIYSSIVLAEIGEKPIWMGLLLSLGAFIPVVGVFVSLAFGIIIGMGVAEKFGKTQGFGVGCGLLGGIFYSILGYGDATYQGAPLTFSDDDILDVDKY